MAMPRAPTKTVMPKLTTKFAAPEEVPRPFPEPDPEPEPVGVEVVELVSEP